MEVKKGKQQIEILEIMVVSIDINKDRREYIIIIER